MVATQLDKVKTTNAFHSGKDNSEVHKKGLMDPIYTQGEPKQPDPDVIIKIHSPRAQKTCQSWGKIWKGKILD